MVRFTHPTELSRVGIAHPTCLSPAEQDRHGVFQMPAHGQNRRRAISLDVQFDWQRGKAPGATKDLHAVGGKANDRVVHRAHDRPVMRQHDVGDGAETARASSVAVAIGSSERLPLVQTIGRRDGRHEQVVRGVYGSMTPRYGLPGATPRGERGEGRGRGCLAAASSRAARNNTIGARYEVNI